MIEATNKNLATSFLLEQKTVKEATLVKEIQLLREQMERVKTYSCFTCGLHILQDLKIFKTVFVLSSHFL